MIGDGVYRSTNGGTSFSEITNDSSSGPASFTTARWMSLGTDGVLYVAHEKGLSRCNGSGWTDITPGGEPSMAGVAADPFDDSRIIATIGDRLYRSTDRGNTWEGEFEQDDGNITRGERPGWFPFDVGAGGYGVFFDPNDNGAAYWVDSYAVWRTEDVWASNITFDFPFKQLENTVPITLETLSAHNDTAPLYLGVADVNGFRQDNPLGDCA